MGIIHMGIVLSEALVRMSQDWKLRAHSEMHVTTVQLIMIRQPQCGIPKTFTKFQAKC